VKWKSKGEGIWTLAKFEKLVEAIQWDGLNLQEIWDTFGCGEIYGPTPDLGHNNLRIHTETSKKDVCVGEWVCRDEMGNLYKEEDPEFRRTHREVMPRSSEEIFRQQRHLHVEQYKSAIGEVE